jgi:hypothetical protein
MTKVARKPAANAHKFLQKKWNECLVACEKMLNSKNPLKLGLSDVVRPTRYELYRSVEIARQHWGILEVDAALKELGFKSLKQDGLPYLDCWDLQKNLDKRKEDVQISNGQY